MDKKKQDKEFYENFVEKYLERFRKYYRANNYMQKKELKKSVYQNEKLSQIQKDNFWGMVIKNI